MTTVIQYSISPQLITINDDPTSIGVSAQLGQILVRTDNNTLYYKSGMGDTAWTLLSAEAPDVWTPITHSIVADVNATDAETSILRVNVPTAQVLQGTSFRLAGWAAQTGVNAAQPTWRVRFGPGASLTGTVVTFIGPGATGGGLAQPSKFESNITFRTVGAGGSVRGITEQWKPDGGGYELVSRLPSADVAVDTSVDNFLEISLESGNAAVSYNFTVALIQQTVKGFLPA